MEYEFPQELDADTKTRAGRMLAAGDVRVTVSGRFGDVATEHITVRFKAIQDNREGEGRNWLRVPLNEATHVFIEVPAAAGDWPDKIGVFYPRNGQFFEDRNADPYRVEAAIMAARWLNMGAQGKQQLGRYRLQEESNCGVCGRALTDPESIDRGIGPECYGRQTDSKHQQKSKTTHPVALGQNLVTHRADELLIQIMDLSEDEVEKIRQELNAWADAGHQVTETTDISKLFDR